MTSQAGSVTRLIPDVIGRNDLAIEELWKRYMARMEGIARPYLVGVAPGAGDEQDVAQSAFIAFCEAATAGQAQKLGNRNELWRLLSTIARHKATDRIRREQRQRRNPGKPAVREGLQQVADNQPSPSEVIQLQEAMDDLLQALDLCDDPKLKLIALMRLEGATTQEISEKLNCTVRTIQRKMHILERLWWDRNS